MKVFGHCNAENLSNTHYGIHCTGEIAIELNCIGNCSESDYSALIVIVMAENLLNHRIKSVSDYKFFHKTEKNTDCTEF